jgi:hypothetical protein
LQHAVEMSQSRAVAVDEFVQSKVAVEHVLVVFFDVDRQILKKLSLHLAERFSSGSAAASQSRIGISPLTQLHRPLSLRCAHLVD